MIVIHKIIKSAFLVKVKFQDKKILRYNKTYEAKCILQVNSNQTVAFGPTAAGKGIVLGSDITLNPFRKCFHNLYKQEAHGPHCSPEKQFQSINTFAQIYD